MAKSKSSANYALIHEKLVYIILIVSTLSLIVSSYTLYELKQATEQPETISMEDFLSKLTSHEEVLAYKGINPSNIVKIDSTNLADLQSQIDGLDISFLGSYLVKYQDLIIIYDYGTDTIKGVVKIPNREAAQLPQDFFAKLNVHPELKGAEQESPTGGILDETSLQALKQQLPDVYADAKVGDYLLRYTDRLVIYDYNRDVIVNAVPLEN